MRLIQVLFALTYLLSGVLSLGIGVLLGATLLGYASLIGVEHGVVASIATGAFGVIATGVALVSALPALLTAIGIIGRKEWGRILGIVMAALYLPAFPIGTIIGALALWSLLSDAGRAEFGGVGGGPGPGNPHDAYPAGYSGYKSRVTEMTGGDDDFVDYRDQGRGGRIGCLVAVVAVTLVVGGASASVWMFKDQVVAGFEDAKRQAEGEQRKLLNGMGQKRRMNASGVVTGADVLDDDDAPGTKNDLDPTKDEKEPVREYSLPRVEKTAATKPLSDDEMKGTYQFIDRRGTVHVVDDYSKIPKRYRDQAMKLGL